MESDGAAEAMSLEVGALPDQTRPPPPPPPPWVESEVEVKSGSTIAGILQDHGLEYSEALQLVAAAKDIHNLEKIRAGDRFRVRHDRNDERLLGLVYPLDRHGERRMVVARDRGGQFSASEEAREVDKVRVTMSGRIEESLWATKDELGLSA